MVPRSLHRLSLDNPSSVFHRHSTEEEVISRRSLPQIDPLCVSYKLSLSSKTKTPGHRGDKPHHHRPPTEPFKKKKKIFFHTCCSSPGVLSASQDVTSRQTQRRRMNTLKFHKKKPRRGKIPSPLSPEQRASCSIEKTKDNGYLHLVVCHPVTKTSVVSRVAQWTW